MRNCWRRRWGPAGWYSGLCLCLILAGQPAAGEEFQPLRGLVGVRSNFSEGDASIEQLAQRAVEERYDVLVVGDDLLTKVEYGIPFLRHLIGFDLEEKSLLADESLDSYLAEVRRVDELFPELVVVAGVATVPFYYWQVDVGEGIWRARGMDRRLLVVGLAQESGYAQLPVSGSRELAVWHWSGLLLLWPFLGLIYAWVAIGKHPTVLRYTVAVVSGICLLNNYPFEVDYWNVDSGDLGEAPYQHHIDRVDQLGGMAFWTSGKMDEEEMGEAWGGRVEIRRAPAADSGDLAHTYGYTGISVAYAGSGAVTVPGGIWDQTLGEYLRGERRRPIWALGDVRADERMETVFLAEERTREGVLEAMRGGRMYALRGEKFPFALSGFHVETELDRAVAGEEVGSEGRVRVLAEIAGPGEEEEMTVQLVRNGKLAAQVKGKAPLEFRHIDTEIEPGERCYYRLLIRSRSGRLLSNPIFVTGVQP